MAVREPRRGHIVAWAVHSMPEPWRWALVDWGYVICDTAMRAHADDVERFKPAFFPSGQATDATWKLPDPPT